MKRVFRLPTTAAVIVVACGVACEPVLPPVADRAGRSLDAVEAGVEEWGTVTISAPLLAKPDARFAFKLNKTADDYFADAQANVQGRAAEFEQTVNQFSFGAEVGVDPMIASQYASKVGEYFRQHQNAERDEANRRAMIARQQELKLRGAEMVYTKQVREAQLTRDAALKKAADTRDAAKTTAGTTLDADLKTANALPETNDTEKQAMQAAVQAANDKHAAAVAAADKQADADNAAAQAAYYDTLSVAESARADSVPNASTAPTAFPTYPDPASQPTTARAELAPDAESARKVLNAQTFAAPGALLASTRPMVISDRTAVITAAGDNATAALFGVLGDPELADKFRDRPVLFGVSMVAVNPGWRTRKGYAADISVVCKYQYSPARPDVVMAFLKTADVSPEVRRALVTGEGSDHKFVYDVRDYDHLHLDDDGNPREGGPSPLIEAVSPMTDTQNLDLQSGFRRQDELALRLSFALHSAGLTAQAAAFEKFVKNRQQDTATATSAVAVNTYSHVGGMFGFQVGPRLVAIEQVRRGKLPGPNEVLDRQSFPCLILIGLERSQLYCIRQEWQATDCKWHLTLYEAQLLMSALPSWTPVDAGVRNDRLKPSQRLGWAYSMAQRTAELDAAAVQDQTPGAPLARVATLAQARRTLLRYKALGGNASLLLPLEVFEPARNEPCVRPSDPPPPAAGARPPISPVPTKQAK